MPRHHLRKVMHYIRTVYALERKPPTVPAIAQACRISVDETRLAIAALRLQGRMVRCVPVALMGRKAS